MEIQHLYLLRTRCPCNCNLLLFRSFKFQEIVAFYPPYKTNRCSFMIKVVPEVEICVFQIKEFAHWTFRQGISSPHQQPHNRTATTQLNFPFSSQVQLIPVLLCSTWSTEITTRQTQGSLISPRHHLHEEASSSPSHNILTPKNTVLKHPLVCWRPRTVPFLFIPAHVKHVHEGWRSFSTPIPAQTLKTESSSCHKMFFTRSSSAVSSAKSCIPYPSGQTAAWVTLSWELRLNRGAVLAGLQ